MVQTLLIFALGFLSAAFLAVAAAPAIWARAVALTRRRVEASAPLTLNELQADKDQQRAEFALTARKLEMNVKSIREKLTLTQVEVARLEAERELFDAERGGLNGKIGENEKTIAALTDQLARKAEALAALEGRQGELVKLVDASAAEIHEKQRQINNLMMDADSHRIELASKMTEQERLAGELSEAKAARAAVDQNLRSTANQLRAAQEEQRVDKRRITELEKKSDRLSVQLADREERLAKREKELDRLKDQVKVLSTERNDLDRRFSSAERQRAHLESQNSGLSQRVTKLASIATPGSADKTIKALESERDKLLERVERLTRENSSVQDITSKPLAAVRLSETGNDLLREKIHELTAKVVRMTAEDEGADSPIPALLGKADKKPAVSSVKAQELPVSLADRIRALEHAARRS